jgi:Domain of unknown function (DUF4397)
MPRWLRMLLLTLAVAALSIFISSCGSNGQAQVRVLNAIPNGDEVDIDVNGSKDFSQLSFGDFAPAPQPAYTSVPSGSVTFEAFLTGTSTSAPPESTFSLSSSTQYTVILTGFNNVDQGTNAATAVPFTDNNTSPASGDLEFRIINASPSSPGGLVDVYIEPSPFNGDLSGVSPTITGLAYQQASTYQSITANPQGSGFEVLVTASGAKMPLIQQNYPSPATGGTITTLVLVDVLDGGQMSPTPIALNDLF